MYRYSEIKKAHYQGGENSPFYSTIDSNNANASEMSEQSSNVLLMAPNLSDPYQQAPQNLIGREMLVTLDADHNVSFFLDSRPLMVDIFHKQPPQAQVVSSKSFGHRPFSPPVDHPWRSYGKKINGLPVSVQDSF